MDLVVPILVLGNHYCLHLLRHFGLYTLERIRLLQLNCLYLGQKNWCGLSLLLLFRGTVLGQNVVKPVIVTVVV